MKLRYFVEENLQNRTWEGAEGEAFKYFREKYNEGIQNEESERLFRCDKNIIKKLKS